MSLKSKSNSNKTAWKWLRDNFRIPAKPTNDKFPRLQERNEMKFGSQN